MVETKVPKDIRKYKTKIVGPLTMRQIICIGIAGVVDFLFFTFVYPMIHIPTNALVYVLILLNLPILAFSLEIAGMPLEKFLIDVVFRNLMSPNRKKSVKLLGKPESEMTGREIRKANFLRKQAGRKDPKYKAYR